MQIRDAYTGKLIREGRAPHPNGTSVHPKYWVAALDEGWFANIS